MSFWIDIMFSLNTNNGESIETPILQSADESEAFPLTFPITLE